MGQLFLPSTGIRGGARINKLLQTGGCKPMRNASGIVYRRVGVCFPLF